jgi:hypothetical protein
VDLLHSGTARRPTTLTAEAPLRLWAGLALAIISWRAAWFGPAPYSEYRFFPLWLGYILAVDGLTMRRVGTSLFARDRRRFASLFVFSIPLWWLFELANHFLDNWRYLLPRPYHPVEYALLASLAFSTVMPAIFVTGEHLRTFAPLEQDCHLLRIDPDRGGLVTLSLIGLVTFLLSLAFPRYLFLLVWIGLFLLFDPINALLGNPSIAAQVREGRWDTALVLFATGLVCGWFWELENVYSILKLVYQVPFVSWPKLFEMPILGYGGYMPFALEVFAAWSLLSGLVLGYGRDWARFTRFCEPTAETRRSRDVRPC